MPEENEKTRDFSEPDGKENYTENTERKERPENPSLIEENFGDEGADFILFLILILMLMGNSNTFNSYFQMIDQEVDKVNQILKAVAVTNESLKGAVEAPQNVIKELNRNK